MYSIVYLQESGSFRVTVGIVALASLFFSLCLQRLYILEDPGAHSWDLPCHLPVDEPGSPVGVEGQVQRVDPVLSANVGHRHVMVSTAQETRVMSRRNTRRIHRTENMELGCKGKMNVDADSMSPPVDESFEWRFGEISMVWDTGGDSLCVS